MANYTFVPLRPINAKPSYIRGEGIFYFESKCPLKDFLKHFDEIVCNKTLKWLQSRYKIPSVPMVFFNWFISHKFSAVTVLSM